MLSIEVPAKFVLTLQSVPPFVFESLFALALALLLSVPLISRFHFLFDDSSQDTSKASLSRKVSLSTIKKRTIVMHYPVPQIKSTSSSSLSVTVTPVRNTISSPTLTSSTEDIKVDNESKKHVLEDPLPLNQSTSFVATNFELPVIDISSVDYEAYRHKIIEALIKKKYDEKQAPGDMVMNTICLNSSDSKTLRELKNKPGYNLFDMKENPEPGRAIKKRELEYLHPLDHFLVQGFRKPQTSDKATETKESITEIDEVPELVGWPSTPKRLSSFYSQRKSINSALNKSKATIKSSSPTVEILNRSANLQMIDLINNNETQQLFRRFDAPKVDVRLDNDSPQSQSPKLSRKQLRTPKRQLSSGSLRKSSKSAKSSQYIILENKKILNPKTSKNDLIIRKEDQNGHSASSSEVGSVSSKFKGNRSKSSLNNSKYQSNLQKCSQPWFSGSFTNSFNRRYLTPRPRSTGGRLTLEKPTLLAKDWHSNPSSASGSRCTTPKYRRSTSPERKTPTEIKIDDENREENENPNFDVENQKKMTEQKSLCTKAPDENSKESKFSVTKSKIRVSSGLKSSKKKSSDQKFEDKKLSEVTSIGAESSSQKAEQTKVVPLSKTSTEKSHRPLPKSSNPSASKPLSSRSRNSESHLPVFTKNCLDKNKLNSDSLLVGKETSENGVKSLERPKSSKMNKLQRPKTASSILCRDSVREVKAQKSEKDNAVKSRDVQIVEQSKPEVVPKNLQTVKSRGLNHLKSSREQKEEEEWLDQSCAQMTKWSSSSTLQDSRVSKAKTLSSATVRISKQISQDHKSIELKRTRPSSKSSSRSQSKTNAALLKTDEAGEISLNQENKERKLPTRDTKMGIAMKQGLRNYIHRVKKTLSERDNHLDSTELASLSLTDAILPDIKTNLNEIEVQQLQELLNRVEKVDSKKSDVHL